MKRFVIVAALAWSMVVMGLSTDAGAARGRRPSRRECAGVTHQPCAPAALRAPKSQEPATQIIECVCAFWLFSVGPGYNYYYGADFYPDCNSAHWCMVSGNYSTDNPDPCPGCPASQCTAFIHNSSHTPGDPRSKPGTKADRLLKWDEKFVLKSGTGRYKRPNGTERVFEFEAKELADAKVLVSFTKGNTQYFAKLHTCRLEAQETGLNKPASITDVGAGQEIQPPPADQKVLDITNQVAIISPNVAQVKIGNVVYQIVTMTPLTE